MVISVTSYQLSVRADGRWQEAEGRRVKGKEKNQFSGNTTVINDSRHRVPVSPHLRVTKSVTA
ncbi:hypothetical protein [Lusitaniella coriacea]|uniref:hypothetical protein n=1 Tax=Lusitaniella coriacea TaxID=1983105 RepID=UPI003CF60903